MAYNTNPFPATYNPQMYQLQPAQMNAFAPVTPPQQQNQNIIWVNGRAGANNFQLAPNVSGLPLWDSEAQTIYIKSTDNMGKPYMKILDYTIREEGSDSGEKQFNYLTREDLHKELDEFMKMVDDKLSGNTKSEKVSVNRNLEG